MREPDEPAVPLLHPSMPEPYYLLFTAVHQGVNNTARSEQWFIPLISLISSDGFRCSCHIKHRLTGSQTDQLQTHHTDQID